MHLQGLTYTRHHWACGKEGPYRQERVQFLHLGLAEHLLRDSRAGFGQAQAIPRTETLGLPLLVPSLQGAPEG